MSSYILAYEERLAKFQRILNNRLKKIEDAKIPIVNRASRHVTELRQVRAANWEASLPGVRARIAECEAMLKKLKGG